MQPIKQKLRSPYVWVPLLCLLVYLVLVRPGQVNYFRDLASAFLHGRLDIGIPENTHDLVFFHQKYYLYWPPVPALVWLPVVALTGSIVPDGVLGAMAGALNVWLVMQLLRRFSAQYALGLSVKTIAWAGIFWGLGTVQFQLAPSGNTWFFAQTIAQTFLLAAVLLFMKERWLWAGLLFALAVYCRNNLVFGFVFFGLQYLSVPHRRGATLVRRAALFALPFVLCSVLNAAYNYARFGDAFENGLQYHLMDAHFAENFRKHGYFSVHYLPYNFYVQVLHAPTLIGEVPFIMPEPEGFGFLWASPLFFLLFPALVGWVYLLFRGKTLAGFRWVTLACWAAAVPVAVTIFLIMGTGWRQYGARYTFDFHFFLLLFLAFMWPRLRRFRWMPAIAVALVVLSVAMQAAGIP